MCITDDRIGQPARRSSCDHHFSRCYGDDRSVASVSENIRQPRRKFYRGQILGIAYWLFIVSRVVADEGAPLATVYGEQLRPILAIYCTDCHGSSQAEAKLDLGEPVTQLPAAQQYFLWRKVLEKMQTGEMPPANEPQLSRSEHQAFTRGLEQMLTRFDCREISQPGRVTIHRLNRTEYNNTVRDLLGVNFSPAQDFPADDVGHGFDNVAEVLSLPPLLMEKYLDAAESIVAAVWASNDLTARLLGTPPPDHPGSRDHLRSILQRHASRAYRRPATPEELERLLGLCEQAEQQGEVFPRNLSWAITATLTSPYFLYRIELDPENTGATTAASRPLNSYELASRLSYFLWSTQPDDLLWDAAQRDALQSDDAVIRQVNRLLADARAEALIDNFVTQWLELRNLRKITPDPQRFPTFDQELREAMIKETQLFARAVLLDNRSILEFLDADYTFVNGALAKHYGLTNIAGAEWQRIDWTDARRGGILTQASILTLTSNPTRTSPVKRGKWILDNVLGAPPPPPPPNAPKLAEAGETELLGSLRERMEQHRADPNCATCHNKMDTLGFGLENFDAIGGWRERDGQFAVDASGELPGAQRFANPAELRQILVTQRRDQFVRCLVEKLLMYALGRELEPTDSCAVDQIIHEVARDEFRSHTLVRSIALSSPFRQRQVQGSSP